MKKNISRYAIRFFLITLALTVIAPLLPGVEFVGSILSRTLLGIGLLLAFEVTKYVSKKAYCIPKGACPHPSIVKQLVFIQVATSICYVGVVGILIPTALSVGGIFSMVFAGLIALLGAVVSGVTERVLKLS